MDLYGIFIISLYFDLFFLTQVWLSEFEHHTATDEIL